MRRLLPALGFAVVCGVFAVTALSQGRGPAKPQGGPKLGPGTPFLHEQHSGKVAVRGKAGETRELKCETCHAISVEVADTNKFPGPSLEKYPETAKLATSGVKLNHLGFEKSHSACIECHKEIAPGPTGKYCGMCHETAQQLRVFPDSTTELSQFADRYSHKAHKDYYDNNTGTFKSAAVVRPSRFADPLSDLSHSVVRASFVAAPPAEKGLRCSTCHDVGSGNTKMNLPKHASCFECHANEKIVTKKADTYAMNCSGCHANMAANKPTVDPALKPPKDALNAVSAESMPFRYVVTPSGKGHAAFNHIGGTAQYHSVLKLDEGKNAGKTLEGKMACMFCHTSVERAANRVQMKAFSIKKTDPQQVQPPGTACVACHVHAVQMTLPAKPTPAARAACAVCHTAADAAKPPPATHASEGAAPAATPAAPAAKPTETPKPATEKPAATKPAPKPEAPKAEPKPETKPATKPAETPAAKPEAAKVEPKPEPAKPEPKPAAPETKPAPAPTPAPAASKPAASGPADYSKGYPPKAPGSSHLSLPNPMLLGDSKTSDQWGLDDKIGISKLTHQDHSEKYKVSCATCHHTNGKDNAALTEDVERCVNCHRAEGYEKNPVSKDGDELDVKNAFHLGETGCINCHKREAEKNPNTKASATCSGCHAPKSAELTNPFRSTPDLGEDRIALRVFGPDVFRPADARRPLWRDTEPAVAESVPAVAFERSRAREFSLLPRSFATIELYPSVQRSFLSIHS